MLGLMRLYQLHRVTASPWRASFHASRFDARALEFAALCVVAEIDGVQPLSFPLSRDMLEF